MGIVKQKMNFDRTSCILKICLTKGEILRFRRKNIFLIANEDYKEDPILQIILAAVCEVFLVKFAKNDHKEVPTLGLYNF